MEARSKIERIGLATGGVVFACFVVYFLIMRIFNLIYILDLRLLNFVFLFAGIIIAEKKYKDLRGQKMDWYLEGIGVGALTCIVAVVPFAIFIQVYLNLDPKFMEYLRHNSIVGEYLTPFTAAFGLAVEELSAGMVFSFMCMQYFKRYVSVKEGRSKVIHKVQ